MTHDHSALLTQLDALKSADPGSVFAELIRAGLQALVDAEATAALGAGRYERTEERTTYRNGTRSKTVSTTSGDVEVQIPKLRAGSFFPSLLAHRRRARRRDCPLPGADVDPHHVSLRLPGCDVLQGPDRGACRVPRAGRGDRGVDRGHPRSTRNGGRGQ